MFKPTDKFLIGSFQVNLLLDNNMGVNSSYYFNLDVYDAPRFSEKLKNIYDVGIDNKMIVSLPIIEEFHPITIINENLPPFVSFNDRNYTVFPKLSY